MAEKLKAVGAPAALIVLPGLGRSLIGKTSTRRALENLKARDATFRFVKQTLKIILRINAPPAGCPIHGGIVVMEWLFSNRAEVPSSFTSRLDAPAKIEPARTRETKERGITAWPNLSFRWVVNAN